MGKIIRTLFGPFCVNSVERDSVLARVRREFVKAIKRGSDCDFVLTCGRENDRFARSLGVKSILVSKDPNPCETCWHTRLMLFICAFDYCDEFVQLDWDTTQTRSLPKNFWERCRERQSFQAPLIQYVRSRCHWRLSHPEIRQAPCGSYIYCRELHDMIEAYAHSMHPRRHLDEIAFARMIDLRLEGKYTAKKYFEAGFEPLFTYNKRSPIKHLLDHSLQIFRHK